MTFEPPAVPPSYTPPQSPAPQAPSYQQQQPSYAQQPQQPQPQQPHPGYPQQPGQNARPPRVKNTLGFVSAILGASGFLLGFIFTFIQLGMYATNSTSAYGLLGGTQSVLDALLGLGAIALGVLGYLKGGPSKLLAIVGTTLGVALLLGVLNGLIFTIALPLIY
ncbi:hypothetical protein [Agreia sp. Leaf283]|uniref:hypothetical protein n=1 Tax=Agreia sp. Leaf283 TaxID=1736321 RepID=UPI0006F9604D|nr:hypothetical protein [Agreia sp. Leaf283]KQP54085.1 hypothetical protein ASF51_18450 [Agreia sp. Leaf283]